MFIKVEKTSSSDRTVFVHGSGGVSNRAPLLSIYRNSLKVKILHSTNISSIGVGNPTLAQLTAGQYVHLAIVNDGTTIKVYFNGVLDTNWYTKPATANYIWSSSDNVTSSYLPNPDGYVNVKEFVWFNTVLSQNDINLLKSA